jgi:hypothetical protein
MLEPEAGIFNFAKALLQSFYTKESLRFIQRVCLGGLEGRIAGKARRLPSLTGANESENHSGVSISIEFKSSANGAFYTNKFTLNPLAVAMVFLCVVAV